MQSEDITIYLYGGWRKYGIIEQKVKSLNHNKTVAYNDHHLLSGETVIPRGLKYSNFCLTREEAVQKAKDIITKEIEAHNRAVARLLQIGTNLK